MDVVTLSPKFQVVIPQKVRETLSLQAGTKFQVITYDGKIEFIPVMEMSKARGFISLSDTSIPRDEEERL
jgi:AbrB family looped-hinge helix DNA binding protein